MNRILLAVVAANNKYLSNLLLFCMQYLSGHLLLSEEAGSMMTVIPISPVSMLHRCGFRPKPGSRPFFRLATVSFFFPHHHTKVYCFSLHVILYLKEDIHSIAILIGTVHIDFFFYDIQK